MPAGSMKPGGKFVVTGVKAIDKKLATFPKRVQRKCVSQAMKAGMRPVLAAAISHAPVLSGILKGLIKLRVKKTKKRSNIAMQVIIQSSQALIRLTKDGKRYFYPALQEFGDDRMDANEFMQPAFEDQAPSAQQIAMRELVSRVEKEASK